MKSEGEQKALERKEKLAGALVCLVAILFDFAVFTWQMQFLDFGFNCSGGELVARFSTIPLFCNRKPRPGNPTPGP